MLYITYPIKKVRYFQSHIQSMQRFFVSMITNSDNTHKTSLFVIPITYLFGPILDRTNIVQF